jgi:hypothetical protein
MSLLPLEIVLGFQVIAAAVLFIQLMVGKAKDQARIRTTQSANRARQGAVDYWRDPRGAKNPRA